jgi:hypothetical protein
MKSTSILLLIMQFGIRSFSQDSSVIREKEFRNIAKVNLTSWIVFNNAYQVGYERQLKNNQSLNIFGGYNEFPINIKFLYDGGKIDHVKNKGGFSAGAEYRFYLTRENKYPAPHGVFLAPFISYYQFGGDRTFSHTNSTGEQSTIISTDLNFINMGGALGYQFVIKKRWVIDAVVFGPSLTRYHFNAKMEGELSGVDGNEVVQKVIEAMKEKLPLLNEFLTNKEVSNSGTERFWAPGFRYSISAGFRF